MNKYEKLAEIFSEKLGPEYDIKYYENNESLWENILIDNCIHGNMLVSSGVTIKAADSIIETQQVSINFVIPTELGVFSKAIQDIEDTFKGMYGPICEYLGTVISYNYNYRSDAIKKVVNGEDYALVTVYATIISYDNAVLAYETSIKIDNQKLNGVINIVYSNQHTADGATHGLSSPLQVNYLSGITVALTVDVLFRKDDLLHLDLMSNADSDKEYLVEYFNGFITRSYKMLIIKLDETCVIGDVIKGQIIFGIRRS